VAAQLAARGFLYAPLHCAVLIEEGTVVPQKTWHSGETNIAVFPILADPVDFKKGDQLSETVSQPSIQQDKVDPPMGS